MRRLVFLFGIIAILGLVFGSVHTVSAQGPGGQPPPYNGAQYGYPFQVPPGWNPSYVDPVRDLDARGYTTGPRAQPVYMGNPIPGDGFRDVEFLGYQDQRMYVHGSQYYQGQPAVIVSPPMSDRGGRVQFVQPGWWGQGWPDWVSEQPNRETMGTWQR